MTNPEGMALDAAINPHCILDLATLAFVTVTKVPLHHLHTPLEGLMDLFRVLPPTCPHLRTCQWKFGRVSFTMSSVLPIPYPNQNFHGYLHADPTLVSAEPESHGSINCNRSLLWPGPGASFDSPSPTKRSG